MKTYQALSKQLAAIGYAPTCLHLNAQLCCVLIVNKINNVTTPPLNYSLLEEERVSTPAALAHPHS